MESGRPLYVIIHVVFVSPLIIPQSHPPLSDSGDQDGKYSFNRRDLINLFHRYRGLESMAVH